LPNGKILSEERRKKTMQTETAASPAEVIEVLKRTALHTLDVYGDHDPDGQHILQGLSAIAQTVANACGLEETALDDYNADIVEAAASDAPADAERVTTAEMRKAHLLVQNLIKDTEFNGDDLTRLTEAAEYLKDFWETANAEQ
jgi:hypothetical protein